MRWSSAPADVSVFSLLLLVLGGPSLRGLAGKLDTEIEEKTNILSRRLLTRRYLNFGELNSRQVNFLTSEFQDQLSKRSAILEVQ